MGDLSEHFSRHEFVCPCCGECRVDGELIDGLEELRRLAGAPIHVISGYRCAKHNASIGRAASGSQHLEGRAADIRIDGLTVGELLVLAEQVPAFSDGGIGTYPEDGTVHVDVRQHIARWTYRDGAYRPIEAA